MKAAEFEELLKVYALGFKNAGASAAHDQIATFASLLSCDPSATLQAFFKNPSLNVAEATGAGQPCLGDVVALLHPLKAIIDVAGTSKSKMEVDAVCEFLSHHAGVSLLDFADAAKRSFSVKSKKRGARASLREDLVEAYRSEFEETLEDEVRFSEYFRRLSADPSMGTQELSALAKAVAKAGARSRDAALKKILARRQTVVAQKARLNATRGRSAA